MQRPLNLTKGSNGSLSSWLWRERGHKKGLHFWHPKLTSKWVLYIYPNNYMMKTQMDYVPSYPFGAMMLDRSKSWLSKVLNLLKFDGRARSWGSSWTSKNTSCLEYFSTCSFVVFILDLELRSRLKRHTSQLIHKFWIRLFPILH